jgi:hypothetical protein
MDGGGGALLRREELVTVIKTMQAHSLDVGVEQEKDHDEGPQSPGNVKGIGHEEMEPESNWLFLSHFQPFRFPTFEKTLNPKP